MIHPRRINNSNTAPRLSIKFLVSNMMAGTVIGTGGNAIKELMEVTDARVVVSGISDMFPGTSERIVLISGVTLAVVDRAQTLMWDMFARNSSPADGDHRKSGTVVTWSPRAASENPTEFNDVVLSGKFTIPASAGGLVIGKGGSGLKSITETSGAKIQMTSKEDALLTQERVVTLTGTMASCAKCVSLILTLLAEDLEAVQYFNRGVTYSSLLSPLMTGIRPSGGQREKEPVASRVSQTRTRVNVRHDNDSGYSSPSSTDVVSSTKITLTVPDSLIGNILGKRGAALREIMSLSGAKVVVSHRSEMKGEGEEGGGLRTVTITGSPAAAQTAHVFVTQKLQQQQILGVPPPRRSATGRKSATAAEESGRRSGSITSKQVASVQEAEADDELEDGEVEEEEEEEEEEGAGK